MSRHRFPFCAAIGALFVLLYLGGPVLTARTGADEADSAAARCGGRKKGSSAGTSTPDDAEKKRHEAEAAIDKMFEATI